ncbi:hypothetical protein LCGC14_0483750 [marine sediment metagenome]|uniref:Uncharacterized protein n=1 Tax=marine sediment metagenome TaxID=412755 RepID=A0A0F9SDV7_9ZZZZ
MSRVRTGICVICGTNGSTRPLYKCCKCNEVVCEIGYNMARVTSAIIAARKGHRKLEVTCDRCTC